MFKHHARLLRLLPAAIAGVVGLMMQVGPSEAEANLCKWVAIVWRDASGSCLQGISPDVLWWIIVLVILGSFAWFVWPFVVQQKAPAPEPHSNLIIGGVHLHNSQLIIFERSPSESGYPQGYDEQTDAYIAFTVSNVLSIEKSRNITSVTDNGAGRLTVNFATDFRSTDIVTSCVGTTPPVKVTEVTAGSVSFEFDERAWAGRRMALHFRAVF